jgi:hypothetical protein
MQMPAVHVSQVAQKLTQDPAPLQVRHWLSSQLLWQTPFTQTWHWDGLQGPQVPFTQVWQAAHRVWQTPPTQLSHAPHAV